MTGEFRGFCAFLVFKSKTRIINSKRCTEQEIKIMENLEPRPVLNSIGLIICKMCFSISTEKGHVSYIEKLQYFPPKLISYF